jgi:diguanylate cyclase (GGDEF)-like protein/PAS domain S-box-containing protein
MPVEHPPPLKREVDPRFEPETQVFTISEDPMEAGSFRLMAEYSVDVLCRLTMDMRCAYCSPSAARVLGWTPEEMLSRFPHDLIHPDDMVIAKTAHARHLNERNCENAPLTARVRRRDGSYVWLEINSRLLRDPLTNEPWQVFSCMRDVSQRILFEETLQALTLTDSLTKLGNRRAFDEAIDREWRRALRDDTPLSLLLLDVDNFKEFNDRYGHQAGDDCLRVIATAVAAVVRRAGDGAFRYGGEEVAVVLPATDEFSSTLIAEQLRASIEAARIPRIGSGHPESPATASIGVATAIPRLGDSTNNPARLFQAADDALYRAKQNGRNRVETATADGA